MLGAGAAGRVEVGGVTGGGAGGGASGDAGGDAGAVGAFWRAAMPGAGISSLRMRLIPMLTLCSPGCWPARATHWQDLTSDNLWFVEGTAEFIQGAEERVAGDVANSSAAAVAVAVAVAVAINGPSNTSAFYLSSYAAARYMHSRIKGAGGEGAKTC
jgi:hypothetical protein